MNPGLPLFEFEASETPDYVPPTAAPSEPAAGPEGEAPPAPSAAPPPEAGPEPLTIDQVAEMMDERFGGLVGYLEAIQQPPPQANEAQSQLPDWDPYDQNVVRAYWQADMQNALREVVGPLVEGIAPVQDIATHYAEREAEAELKTRFDAIQGGKFDQGQARLRAEHHVQNGLDVDRAITQAANEQYAWEQERQRLAVEAYQQQARTSHEAQQGGPPAGAGAPVTPGPEGPPEGVDPFDWQLQRSISAAKGVQPVG